MAPNPALGCHLYLIGGDMFIQRYEVDTNGKLDCPQFVWVEGTDGDLTINFNYINNDSNLNLVPILGFAEVSLGLSSERLYSIRIDLNQLPDFESKESSIKSFMVYGIVMRILELYKTLKNENGINSSVDIIRDHWMDLLYNEKIGFIL